jgi:hypothetical protein
MNALNPTNLSRAAETMADELGLEWPKDRREIIKAINLYRNLLYNQFSDFRMFDGLYYCLEPQVIRTLCADPCDCEAHHLEISLPPEAQSILGAWSYGKPFTIHSRWREALFGIDQSAFRGELILTALDGIHVTQRPVQKPSLLSFIAKDPADDGKVVDITIETTSGSTKSMKVTLQYDKAVASGLLARKVLSVVLPPARCGEVVLLADDEVISTYLPDETVPSYSRYRVAQKPCMATFSNTCCPSKAGSVLVKCTRRFTEISLDHHVVEVGDPMILISAATYFRYWKSKDQDERTLSKEALATMYALLKGLKDRAVGMAIQDGPSYHKPVNTKNHLYEW